MHLIRERDLHRPSVLKAQRFLDELHAAEVVSGKSAGGGSRAHWPKGLWGFVAHLEQNGVELSVHFKTNPLPNQDTY